MCGIAGFFGTRAVSSAAIAAIFASINRRGPDAHHMVGWDGDGISHGIRHGASDGSMPSRANQDGPLRALLHTRLSIRDPRSLADQPMSNATQDVWICYNGEVYGWEEAAQELEAQGFPFHTRSDTEFILNGYLAWGFETLLAKLRGMFALTILDLRKNELWLVRDRLGLKPLVYYHNGAGEKSEFAFGSVVRAVLPYLPADKREFSAEGIDAYLAHRYIPAPRTIFQHVQRLENGHYLRFDLTHGTLEKQAYWSPDLAPVAIAGVVKSDPKLDPNSDALMQTLDESVRLRTVADRPVGLFLSSGIDSSVIASRLAALGYKNLRTFTAGFSDPAMDESEAAASIAADLGMPNTRIDIPTSIRNDFAQIVADLDEPFADPSSFPTWYLASQASQHVKVVLSGDGGDELFGGYKRYRQHLRSAWRAGFSWAALEPKASLVPTRWQKLRLELSQPWREAYALRFSGFTLSQRKALQTNWTIRAATYWRRQKAQSNNNTAMVTLAEIDRLNYLPEYILRKADLTTMAHGLEGRAPLLDQVFCQHVLAMDQASRFTQPAKLAIAEGCAPKLKEKLFQQKKKGFNPPLRRWLREDLNSRLSGIGERLQANSGGQLSAPAVEAFVAAYSENESLAEQVLQLLILDESLGQLDALRKATA